MLKAVGYGNKANGLQPDFTKVIEYMHLGEEPVPVIPVSQAELATNKFENKQFIV